MGTLAEDFHQGTRTEHLLVEQRLGHLVELVTLLHEQRPRSLAGLVDDLFDLRIDHLRGSLRVRLVEDRLVVPAARQVEANLADALAHPIVHDHRVRHLGDPLQVVLCTRRHAAEDDLLGNASADGHGHAVDERLTGVQVALLGEVLRVAQCREPARHDRHLHDRVGVLQEPAHDGVPRLVEGDDFTLLRRDELVLLLQPGDHAVDRLLEVLHLHDVFLFARG